jgi:hypothetical protein
MESYLDEILVNKPSRTRCLKTRVLDDRAMEHGGGEDSGLSETPWADYIVAFVCLLVWGALAFDVIVRG